jgi:shikimate dehydrogenase
VSRCRAAVLGRPVGHSLSPVIHNAGFRAAGLTGWAYGAHEVDEAALPAFVAGLGTDWAGLSLTMPLKHAALTIADEITDTARLLGAANTLVRLDPAPGDANTLVRLDPPPGDANTLVRLDPAPGDANTLARLDPPPGDATTDDATAGGATVAGGERAAGGERVAGGARWRADNTDAPGLVDALRGVGVEAAKRVALLGAGGTARAAVWAAARLGAAELVVYARRSAAVDELRDVADRLGLPLIAAGWADAAGCADRADVVISTVPAGAADDLAGQVGWHGGVTVFDVLYHPWPTRLAAAATAGGATVVGGLELLLAQAVHQFEQFTGVPAPIPAMRAALHDAAAARDTTSVRDTTSARGADPARGASAADGASTARGKSAARDASSAGSDL